MSEPDTQTVGLCPICGKASYSVGGIHPQCSMQKADEPRLAKLKATKNTETKVKKPVRQSWKKKCPQCGTEIHVRLQECACGHKFTGR